MEPAQTSLELLAHFDRPKTIDNIDIDSVAAIDRSEPTEMLEGQPRPTPLQPGVATRGIGWVLRWAAAVVVLTFSASVLAEIAYLSAAEHKLAIAARAGALEATLPRATQQTVVAAVARRLAGYPRLRGQLQIGLLQNGLPSGPRIRPGDGDRFSLTLAAPTSAVVPEWLHSVVFWREDSQLRAHAERQAPSRVLARSGE